MDPTETPPVVEAATSKPKKKDSLDRGKEAIQLRKAEIVQLQTSKYFDPIAYAHFKAMATDFIAAGAISGDVKNVEQMIMKFQAGYELGLAPIEALNSLYIINGHISFYGAALVRRLRVHGWKIRYEEDKGQSTAFVEKNGEMYQETITFEDAQASGWTAGSSGLKPGWKLGENRKLKLRYGALNTLVKTYIPEVLGSATGITEIVMDTQIEDLEQNQREQVTEAIQAGMKDIDGDFFPVVMEPSGGEDA